MAIFTYKAKTASAEIIEDTIQAANKADAVAAIKSRNLELLTLKEMGGAKDINLFGGGISVSEKGSFCRFMSTMLKSGMSLPEAIDIIRDGSNNKKLKKVLTDISYQTQKGKSLSAAISQYKNDFDPIFLTMVKVGEESGTLEKSFDYLAKQLSASYELSQKIKGSLMYPAVIVVAMIGNGLMMALFVLPRIAGAFLKLDVPLPAYTRLVLGAGEFFGKNVPLVLGFVLASGVGLFALFTISTTRRIIFSFITKLPVVSTVVQHIDIARFARTLSTLLKSGVPIIEALDVSANTLSRAVFKNKAKMFGEKVSKGESLYDVIKAETKLFPSIMIQTIRAGEKSGSLEVVLEELADFYEKEVEFSLKKFTSLLEPLLMLVVGVVVGVMVIIMIAPIYSIIGGLQSTIQK